MSKNTSKKIYHVDLPYPEIKVEKKNLRYANMLLHAYSGMVSEFTAIDQYVYHKFKVFKDYPSLAEDFGGIAMVEMHHLEILGKLISILGGDPKFWIKKKDKNYYWDGKFVDYGNTPKEYLTYDIHGENLAIRDYSKLRDEIHDVNIIAIIDRIILDEELHIEILKELYNKFV